MTTEQALLADILAKPDDDLPRLVYADWLDERDGAGDRERAEFIRVQVELAKWPENHIAHIFGDDRDTADDLRFARLICNQQQLFFDKSRADWFGGVRATILRDVHDSQEPSAHVRRGFISEVRCTLADWCGGECWCTADPRNFTTWADRNCPDCTGTGRTPGIGPAVVRSHPVERVVLTDKRAIQGRTDQWALQFVDRPERHWELPRDWYTSGTQHLFATEGEAAAAVSRLAILWAKAESFNQLAFNPHPQAAHIPASSVS